MHIGLGDVIGGGGTPALLIPPTFGQPIDLSQPYTGVPVIPYSGPTGQQAIDLTKAWLANTAAPAAPVPSWVSVAAGGAAPGAAAPSAPAAGTAAGAVGTAQPSFLSQYGLPLAIAGGGLLFLMMGKK
jgi:hypothetical protein